MSSPPTKEQREKCWIARDSFWNCLDGNGDDFSKCKSQRQQFEGSCSKQWLKYFDRRREYLKFKDKLEKDGFEPITNKKQS